MTYMQQQASSSEMTEEHAAQPLSETGSGKKSNGGMEKDDDEVPHPADVTGSACEGAHEVSHSHSQCGECLRFTGRGTRDTRLSDKSSEITSRLQRT